MHDELYELKFPYGIHYICDMALTCYGASHCICTGTSYFMGVSAWLKSKTTLVIDERERYRWTKSNRVTLLHEMVKENFCRVIARRARHSHG